MKGQIRVRELQDWPPRPGGAFVPRGFKDPASGEATLSRIVSREGELLTFVGKFEGRDYTYDFTAPNENVATQLEEAFGKHLGKSVFDLGDIQVEIEE